MKVTLPVTRNIIEILSNRCGVGELTSCPRAKGGARGLGSAGGGGEAGRSSCQLHRQDRTPETWKGLFDSVFSGV